MSATKPKKMSEALDYKPLVLQVYTENFSGKSVYGGVTKLTR
jgi:hypothetical protein